MLCEDYSNKRQLREACYSLLTIAIGFLSCSIIALLTYYTYQTALGNISFCSLWTDIPGRLVLFLTFYYAAGVCGALPIPERLRGNCLPPPFIIYRFQSWKRLIGKFCRLLSFNCEEYESLKNDPEISPQKDEYNQRPYESLENEPEIPPRRDECNERDDDRPLTPTFCEKSKNIQISKIDTPQQPVVQSNKSFAERYKDMGIASSSEDCSASLDSPIVGQFLQMTKGKSSKPCYLPDSGTSISELTEKSISVDAPSVTLYEISETLNDRGKAVSAVSNESDTPPRTPDVELPLPSYPRFPWSFLKEGSDVPYEAKALHKRNLMIEKQEINMNPETEGNSDKIKEDL